MNNKYIVFYFVDDIEGGLGTSRVFNCFDSMLDVSRDLYTKQDHFVHTAYEIARNGKITNITDKISAILYEYDVVEEIPPYG